MQRPYYLDNSKVKSKAVIQSHQMLQFLTQLRESLDFIIQGFDFLRHRFYFLEEIKLESKQNVNVLGSIVCLDEPKGVTLRF